MKHQTFPDEPLYLIVLDRQPDKDFDSESFCVVGAITSAQNEWAADVAVRMSKQHESDVIILVQWTVAYGIDVAGVFKAGVAMFREVREYQALRVYLADAILQMVDAHVQTQARAYADTDDAIPVAPHDADADSPEQESEKPIGHTGEGAPIYATRKPL